eukprot:15106279-Ditylum_brightwellii.AAC.2
MLGLVQDQAEVRSLAKKHMLVARKLNFFQWRTCASKEGSKEVTKAFKTSFDKYWDVGRYDVEHVSFSGVGGSTVSVEEMFLGGH